MSPSSLPQPAPALSRWYRFDSHHRLATSLILAAVGGLLVHGQLRLASLSILIWDIFAGCSVIMAWAVMLSQDPFETRRSARLEDASRTVLFVLVIGAAISSLFGVGMILGAAKGLPRPELGGHMALSFAAVALSWALIHTVFALRYAHHYYKGAKEKAKADVSGGLIFPGEENPAYLDFAYFSFVIGMTCQVSDVQICSRSLRRVALCHGLIAFIFNTAILALFVNIVAGLV